MTEYAEIQGEGKVKGSTLSGYASVFNFPIDSGTPQFEQTTLVQPGAFHNTIPPRRSKLLPPIVAMVNHGLDPRFGQVPIGRIVNLAEDKRGLKVDIELHGGPDNDNIKAALASGSMTGMSIQFDTVKEQLSDDRSERMIQSVKLYELGPVSVPANAAARATLHSREAIEERFSEVMWDGAAALRSCSGAADFRKIAFERANDSDPDTAAHWALPHHPSPSAGADPTGVGAALAALHGGRGGAPDLVQSVDTVERHLQAHQAEFQALRTGAPYTEDSASPPGDDSGLQVVRASQLLWLSKLTAEALQIERERYGV